MTIREPVDKKTQALFVQADQDLVWLADHGALAGAAEVLRERRRQIEKHGWPVDHDDGHASGWLAYEAGRRLAAMFSAVSGGAAGYPETEAALRDCAALCAAEIDRLNRMLDAAPIVVNVQEKRD